MKVSNVNFSIKVKNMEELKLLVEKAENEFNQLKATLAKIESVEITLEAQDSIQETAQIPSCIA